MSLFRFVVAMILVAGWGLAALCLHVVRTTGGVQVLTKNKLSLVDTYVDVRKWDSDDEDKHADFYERVKQLDQTKILEASAEPEVDRDLVAPVTRQVATIGKAWSRANSVRGR